MQIVQTLDPTATAVLRAATMEGLKLPAHVQAAREHMESLEAELASLPAATLATPDAGLDAIEAATQASRLREAAEHLEAAREAVTAKYYSAVGVFNATLLDLETADAIILAIRPHVARLVKKAAPLASILEPFYPGYNASALVREGTGEHLEAYQQSVMLEASFGRFMAAWRGVFRALHHPQNRYLIGGHADIREIPSGRLFWAEHPALVEDDGLAGRRLSRTGAPVEPEPTVLTVAREKRATFRLATVSESLDIFEETFPQAPGRSFGPDKPTATAAYAVSEED